MPTTRSAWHAFLFAALFGLLPLSSAQPRPPDDDRGEEKALAAAGLTEDSALLQFLRDRTLTPADCKLIEGWIAQLGSDKFDTREKAQKTLLKRGSPVAPFVRRALNHPDLEIQRRARRILISLEGGSDSALAFCAVRQLARRAAANDKLEVAGVFLNYLPYANSTSLEEEIIDALLVATPAGRPPHKALVEGLTSPLAGVREASAHVVARRGDKGQRERVRRLLADRQPTVRLRAAEALLAARDKEAVPALAELLTVESVSWHAEALLYRLAGDRAPALETGARDEAGRKKLVAAWLAWWKENREKVDLASLEDDTRLLGFTLAVEYNTGRVWECGPDGKLRWDIRGLLGPMEAQILPGNKLLIAESNNNSLTERNTSGKVLWKKDIGVSPTGCQRLLNGNTFVSTYTEVMEFNSRGEQVYRFTLPQGSNAIWKARNGLILSVGGNVLFETDTAGKEVGKVPLPAGGSYVGIQDLPGERFLLACSTRGAALEVDRAGKVLWEAKLPGTCGVSRLPNGNTLVSSNMLVAEFDRSGRKVWQVKSEGYVRRIHRR